MDGHITIEKSVQNPFTRLREDSICEILSRTLPVDVFRFAVVSKELKPATDSNELWDRFLPMEILSRSSYPAYGTKKEFYLSLCDTPSLVDGGKLSIFLDKRTGKKCFILECNIEQEGGEWISLENSRFSRAMKLSPTMCKLDIRTEIVTQMLSEKTTYAVYIIFKVDYDMYELKRVHGIVQEVACDSKERIVIVFLTSNGGLLDEWHSSYCGTDMPWIQYPVIRDDGWMEIELIGGFFSDLGDENGVDHAQFMRIKSTRVYGRGLIAGAIEVRPKTPIDNMK